MNFNELVTSLAYGGAYSLLGIVLLAAGFFAFDLITPGNLGTEIYRNKSANAALIVAAVFLGIGAIQFTAIWHNADAGFGSALVWTTAFGVMGIVLQSVAFLLLDLITPGSLRQIAVEGEFHPGAGAAAAAVLAVSMVICASIA